MSFDPPSGYARCTHVFALSGDPQEQTFHLDVEDSGVNPQDTAEAIFNCWEEAWGEYLSNQYTFRRVDVYGRDGAGVLYEQSYGENFVGPGAAGYLPQNNALLVRKLTGSPGRKNKGRSFMVGLLAEGFVNGAGVIDSSFLADLQIAANAWKTNLDAIENITAAVVISSDPADLPTAINGFQVDNIISTQRRRLR